MAGVVFFVIMICRRLRVPAVGGTRSPEKNNAC